jgi:hypothetical protein
MQLKIERIIKGWGVGKNIAPASEGFIENGYGRKYAKERTAPFLLEAFSAFNLTPKYVEPMFEIFTGIHYLSGAHTHIHQDSAPQGFVHVRCNVMLKKPSSGGDPILDDEILDVEEGDLWLCLASLERHGSTPISEPFRIVKSFGSLIEEKQVMNLI